MKDLKTEKDIIDLVEKFYSKVRKDATIGHFFNGVIDINWDTHIPKICSFWNGILFDDPSYKGNAMLKHMELDRLSKIDAIHVDKWMELWKETISDNYIGDIAEKAIVRAHQVAELMKFKLSDSLF